MKVLKNNKDRNIVFWYGGREYATIPGEVLQVNNLVIDHYIKNIGGDFRLDVIDTEAPIIDAEIVEPVAEPTGEVSSLNWNELRKLATSKGIEVFGKKRAEVEKELSAL